jgi:hypothetical protein
MLTESELIRAVCGFLESNGFQVRQALCETEGGVDILAIAPNGKRQVSIEVKGEMSSKSKHESLRKAFQWWASAGSCLQGVLLCGTRLLKFTCPASHYPRTTRTSSA